jgi:glycosyltransferase involved in cell wall biosynthesis
MRILVVIFSLQLGGAERATAKLSGLWTAAGHRVTIATFSADDKFYQVDPSVRVLNIDLAKKSRGILDALFANVRRVRALRALIRSLDPDLTVGMMDTASVLVALAGLGLRSRTLGAERRFPPELGGPWAAVRKFAYRFLDIVIAQTDLASAWLRTHTHARHLLTIPNAVEWPLSENEPTIPPATVLPPVVKLVLAVGRLVPTKGFIHLIEAFGRLEGVREDWGLVILGDGPERAALEKRVRALGLERCVFLPGTAGNMESWYKRASLFALTSLHEGFPNVLLEAMAAGVPSVSFDCLCGPREIIRHGVDGLLVPVGDETALAKSMVTLMNDDQLRAEMAGHAIAVRERFSQERMLALWNEAFEAACGTRDIIRLKRLWRSN